MQIESRDFGEIEIKKEDIIEFPKGIPGFLEQKEYVFLPVEDSPFIVMQSIEQKDLAFISIEPGNFFSDYDFEIDERTKKMIKLEDSSQVTVFNITTLKKDIKQATVNLAAPVIVNFNQNLGRQVILDDDLYPVKQPLFSKQEQTEMAAK